MRLAVLFLAGCSWSSAITQMSPTPVPAGTCLQITHPGPHRWDLYKGEHRVGANEPGSYERAYDDHLASAALIADSKRDARLAAILGASGMVAGVATVGAGAMASSTTAMGIGLGVMLTSLVTAGILAYLSDARWGDSVDEYNAWAAVHGCR